MSVKKKAAPKKAAPKKEAPKKAAPKKEREFGDIIRKQTVSGKDLDKFVKVYGFKVLSQTGEDEFLLAADRHAKDAYIKGQKSGS